MNIIFSWVLHAAALVAVTQLVSSVHVDGYGSALIAAIVIGLVNALIKPLLLIITLPLTVLTLGIFILVINALCFWLAGSILRGFVVDGFTGALLGALVYSVLSYGIRWLLSNNHDKREA